MRKRRLGLVAIAVMLSMIWLPMSSAYAVSCATSHCYGVALWHPNPIHGIAESLTVSCLSVPSPSANFVTQEMWLGTGGSAGAYWVEEGMAYGNPQGGRRYWFWADSRPNGGEYNEHDLSISANLHTAYASKIVFAGNDSWDVYRNGARIGTSTHNAGLSVYESLGEETTTSQAQSAATHYGMMYRNSGEVWHSGWRPATIHRDEPPFGYWNHPWDRFYAYSNCSLGARQESHDQRQPQGSKLAGNVAPALKGLAIGLAKQNGEANPTSVHYVATHRQAAVATVSGKGSVVESDQPVYLVTMAGYFTGFAAKVPHGQAPPRGSVLSLTVDPATSRVLDWGITDSTPNLPTLGRVVPVS